MTNTQPTEGMRYSDGSTLDVISVYETIQGEGPLTGMPAVFIRLAGCNLQCSFCDTDYTSGRKSVNVDEIIEIIKLVSPNLVVITGGEPFRQNVTFLATLLLNMGKSVQIETNGLLEIPMALPKDVSLVCSPKTKYIHPHVLNYIMLNPENNCFKYIIYSKGINSHDGLPKGLFRPPSVFPRERIFVQPMAPPLFHRPLALPYESDPSFNENVIAAVGSCLDFGYRLSIQIHKVIGMP